MARVTPMLQQYLTIKDSYPDMLLFFRLGDFYELFFEDAEIASRILEITLTARPDSGGERKIPMCGVPYHAAEGYLTRLVAAGYRVAICDQVQDAKEAVGIVDRQVVRVVTPGTANLSGLLRENRSTFLVALAEGDGGIALAVAEASTGSFAVTMLGGEDVTAALRSELLRLEPAEVLLDSTQMQEHVLAMIEQLGMLHNEIPCPDAAVALFELQHAELLKTEMAPSLLQAAAMVHRYLLQTAMVELRHMQPLRVYAQDGAMQLDPSTRRSLELVATMRENVFKGSLLSVIDRTQTVMGARLLRQWLLQPLVQREAIEQRLYAVSELKENSLLRMDLVAVLDRMYDLERLLGRVSFGSAHGRDMLALQQSLALLPEVTNLLQQVSSPLLQRVHRLLPDLSALALELQRAIGDEPPLTLREGGIIRDGYNEELDKYRLATRDGRQWIAALEQQERERTGIRSLKIGFNKVFGYYLEVTNPQLGLVPNDYIRKQTLANCERYVTPQLKEIEETLLGASEKGNALEYQLFAELRERVNSEAAEIQRAASLIAELDCLLGFAQLAEERRYVQPQFSEQPMLHIVDGRHPVVEVSSDRPFVANDVQMEPEQSRILIITGPNMAGKSTYLRMAALIVLMAQIGCFVPASQVRMSVFDRIFTRVGSGDDLAGGQSTFMVEMSELSTILAEASSRSLLVLDEIGRGTSTYDGMSIARATLEYIHNPRRLGALTLFATHYHELTDMAEQLSGIRNYSVAVRERGEQVVFLHRITPGAVDKSYGIAVARLAGLPKTLLDRALDILQALEAQRSVQPRVAHAAKQLPSSQLSLIESATESELQTRLQAMDITNMTPIEALNALYDLQKLIK